MDIFKNTKLNRNIISVINKYVEFTLLSYKETISTYGNHTCFKYCCKAIVSKNKLKYNVIWKYANFYDHEYYYNIVNFLENINHPNIIKLLGQTGLYQFNDWQKSEFGLVLESDENMLNLFEQLHNIDYINKCGYYGPKLTFNIDKKKIITNIILALIYLHSKNIFTYNLRTINIHLFPSENKNEYVAKLANIENYDLESRILDTIMYDQTYGCLNSLYQPPETFTSEIIKNKNKYNVYQLGLLICELYLKELPFKFNFFKLGGELYIYKNYEKDRYDLNNFQNQKIAELCKKCLNINHTKRPTINEILDEWLLIE
jgi:serine/threonine protein kinase